MAGLLALPAELIASVCQYIGTDEIFAVRRSCTQLERFAFSYFAPKYFRKKGFLVLTPSLDALQSIASHNELRTHVQHIWLNPDCFTYDTWERLCQDYRRSSQAKDQRVVQTRAWEDYKDDNARLLHTSDLTTRLVEALAEFPNLRTVGMRRSTDHYAHGCTTVQRATDRDARILGPIPEDEAKYLSGPTRLFEALVAAVAQSTVSIERFYTDAIEFDNIPASRLEDQTLSSAFQTLLYLEVNAVKGSLAPSQHYHRSASHYSDGRYPGSVLVQLLSHAPKLRELGLQIFPNNKQSYHVAPTWNRSQSWRVSYPYLAMRTVAETVQLTNLRRLKLEKLTMQSSMLVDLLSPAAATLRSLKLRDIRLIPWRQGPDGSTVLDGVERPWRTVFVFLATSCPSLSFLLLHRILHDSGVIMFVPEAPGSAITVEDPPGSEGIPFAMHDTVTVTASGLDEVQGRVRQLVDAHWYGDHVVCHSLDDRAWHTDTSDEDW
nr:hypothetical protein B0A51_05914 [Rachicladosporium sp. CCFEE 5018]